MSRTDDPRETHIDYDQVKGEWPKCNRAPAGWHCTRGYHSDGPCAAVRDVPQLAHLDAARSDPLVPAQPEAGGGHDLSLTHIYETVTGAIVECAPGCPAQPGDEDAYEVAAAAAQAKAGDPATGAPWLWAPDDAEFRAAIDAALVYERTRTAGGEDPKLTEAQQEIERLTDALKVCEFVLHRAEPTDAQIHAGQQASGAWSTEWYRTDVWDDLPNFDFDKQGGPRA